MVVVVAVAVAVEVSGESRGGSLLPSADMMSGATQEE